MDEAGKTESWLDRSSALIEISMRAIEQRRWIAFLAGAASFLLIAVVDLVTPEEVSFALFYALPVGILAVVVDGPWPWLLAAAGAALWPVDHLIRGQLSYFQAIMAWWEPAVRLGFYAMLITGARLIRRYLRRQREADGRLRAALSTVRDAEQRYREVFEHSSSGILVLDVLPGPAFRVAALNPYVERLAGIPADQATGRFVDEVLPARIAEPLAANWRRAVLDGRPLQLEGTFELPPGWRTVTTSIIPLKDERGRVARLINLPNDITEKSRAEAALRESEQRYREVFENTSDGIFVLEVTPDRRYRVAAFNAAMERMTGFRNDQVVGKLNEEFLSRETAAQVAVNNERCLEAGAPITFDQEVDLPRGHFWWHTTLVPVRDGTGVIRRIIGVSNDVTETVRALRALRQSEEKFSRAFHASPDAITITRLADGVLREVNQGFLAAYGYRREEVIGRSSLPGGLGIWADPADRRRLTDLLREKGEVTDFEAVMRRSNGEPRFCVLSSRTVQIGDEECILTISRDLTERRRMEEAVRESEARYREVLENTSDGIFAVEVTPDLRFRLLSYNPAQERILGISAADVVGKFTEEYLPADLAKTVVEQNRRCVEAGVPMTFEGTFELPAGTMYYSTTLVPVRDAGGRVARLVGVTQDTTERRRLEVRQREHDRQLFQAAKLASLGTLVSGIAHEINNPNNFIRLNSQNLAEFWRDIRPALQSAAADHEGVSDLRGVPLPEALAMIDDLLTGIDAGSRRIEKLVLNLRDFARGDEGDLAESVDVNAAVDSAVMIVGNLVRKSTDSFSFRRGDHLPPVRGSSHQVEQVVINLITNACQALPSRDRAVTVVTRAADERAWVEIEVSDQGIGIPDQNLPRITDPFFTTKRADGGSGLGLAVSSRIVDNHGGQMSFFSSPGGGTRAVVRLPAARNP